MFGRHRVEVRESVNEAYLFKRFRELGGFADKFSNGRIGCPDRIVLLREPYYNHPVTAIIEVKENGGHVRPEQRREMERLRGFGLRTGVLYDRNEVDQFIRDYFGTWRHYELRKGAMIDLIV